MFTLTQHSFAPRLAGALLVLAPALLQCKSDISKSETVVLTAPEQTYHVRGKLVSVPKPSSRVIEIQHEAIPTFLNESKVQVGMVAMTMPFDLANDVAVDSFTKGDLVEFSLEVRWQGEPRLLIRQMSRLPADTALNLDD